MPEIWFAHFSIYPVVGHINLISSINYYTESLVKKILSGFIPRKYYGSLLLVSSVNNRGQYYMSVWHCKLVNFHGQSYIVNFRTALSTVFTQLFLRNSSEAWNCMEYCISCIKMHWGYIFKPNFLKNAEFQFQRFLL